MKTLNDFIPVTIGIKPKGPFIKLGTTKSKHKDVHLWAFKGFHHGDITSNSFEMEFYGKMIDVEENDKADWFTINQLEEKLFKSQSQIIPQLKKLLRNE